MTPALCTSRFHEARKAAEARVPMDVIERLIRVVSRDDDSPFCSVTMCEIDVDVSVQCLKSSGQGVSS